MNNWYSGLLGISLGMLVTVIFFNYSAQEAISLDENVTMNSYWFGK